jgi:hypothetical protein
MLLKIPVTIANHEHTLTVIRRYRRLFIGEWNGKNNH